MAANDPHVVPIPLQVREKRDGSRVEAAMPLVVDGRHTTTQNVSPEGIAFECELPRSVGERVHVVVEYLLDGAHFPLECEAEIVRVEPQGDRWLVGARLLLAPSVAHADVGQPSTEAAA